MSELVREYTAHLFDKSMFKKRRQESIQQEREEVDDETQRKVEEELNLTLNPTSLLEQHQSTIVKKMAGGPLDVQQDSILSSTNNKNTINKAADFLSMPAGGSGTIKSP